jgi:hypothetical protein
MFSRLQSSAFLGLFLFIGVIMLLAACDSVPTDNLTGVWIGEASFTADSILADQNLRFVADFTATFTFRITDDDGLVTGTVEAAFDGSLTTTEAGQAPQSLTFDPASPINHEVFGTYVKPVLEMDVPDGPYEENLWTFDVSGSGADLNRPLSLNLTVVLADSSFTFPVESDDFFELEYDGSE